MTASQYVGRVYDILSLRGAVPRGRTVLSQTLFDVAAPGTVCTGVQKLAQRWALEFLTIRGSMGFHLQERGTDFMRIARQGAFRSELDVQTEYDFAAVQVRQNLLAEETPAMHAEDRFGTDDLQQILLGPDFLELSVTIISLAGDSRSVILPINITPTNLNL